MQEVDQQDRADEATPVEIPSSDPPAAEAGPDLQEPAPPAPTYSFDESARRSARIIALANQKGGVGKTTTTISLAAALAEVGQKVLVVDFDPQGGCSLGLGIEPGGLEESVYNALLDRNCEVENVVLKTQVPGLELLPSNIDLSAAELMLVQDVAREQSLMRVLAPLRNSYDFILIDCPPSLGLLTLNTLAAADSVLIPIQCEFYALEGLSQLLNTVTIVQKNLNPALQIEGVLLTMYDGRLNLSRQVAEEAKEYFGPKVYRTTIPRNVRIAEAPSFGKPIVLYDVMSVGAKSYLSLAKEVIARKGRKAAATEPATAPAERPALAAGE